MVRPAIREAMDQPRVAVVGEHDRLVGREQGVELVVGQPVRMLLLVLQAHEVDHVDEADLELRQVLADQVDRCECLDRRDVPGAGHHDVGLAALVVGRPVPDPDAAGAVEDRLVHRQPVGAGLLARDDHVDVVPAAQAVVTDRQERVRVRWQVDADDVGLLVHHVVDEARVLVAEAVVVLPPDERREHVVERRDRPAPRDVAGDLEPLRVLVEHRIDDVDERFVAVEDAVAPGEEVALEPALALVLAEHLHHAALGRLELVRRQELRVELAVRDLEHGAQPVRLRSRRARTSGTSCGCGP